MSTGPFSITADFTVRVSDDRLLLFSAFAIALLSVFTISRADLTAFIIDEVQTGRFVQQRIFVKG